MARLRRNTQRKPTTNFSNVENGTQWLPNPYPTQTNDFRAYFHNVRMHQGGSTGGTKHGFYIETNGYTFADWNNCHLLGANKCSNIKTVVGFPRVRNCYIPFCATPNSPYDSLFWSQENIDIHSHINAILYNNEIVTGRDSAWGTGAPFFSLTSSTGNQNGALAFSQSRRPAYGSSTPMYADVAWSPPETSGDGGPASPNLGAFPTGPATFVDSAFWSTPLRRGCPFRPAWITALGRKRRALASPDE